MTAASSSSSSPSCVSSRRRRRDRRRRPPSGPTASRRSSARSTPCRPRPAARRRPGPAARRRERATAARPATSAGRGRQGGVASLSTDGTRDVNLTVTGWTRMARDLAIDLGTANTLVYMKGRGIVLNEPSVIALNRQTGEVLATGREAWQMIGRTPGYIVAVRPLRGGAITDFEITERMIRLLLQRVGVSRFTRPKVVICVPSAITEVERRAVTDAPAGPAPPTPTSSSSRWRRPSAPTCRSTSRSATWSSTSAAARARRRSSASAASSPSRPCASARSTSTRDPELRAPGARHRHRRAHGRGDQGRHRLGRSHRGREPGRGPRPRPDDRAAEDRAADARGDPLRHRGRRLVDHRLGDPLPGEGAAGAVAGLPRARHVPRRWWWSAARLASRIQRETKVPVKLSNVPLEAVVLGAGHVIEHYEALKGMFMGARR